MNCSLPHVRKQLAGPAARGNILHLSTTLTAGNVKVGALSCPLEVTAQHCFLLHLCISIAIVSYYTYASASPSFLATLMHQHRHCHKEVLSSQGTMQYLAVVLTYLPHCVMVSMQMTAVNGCPVCTMCKKQSVRQVQQGISAIRPRERWKRVCAIGRHDGSLYEQKPKWSDPL